MKKIKILSRFCVRKIKKILLQQSKTEIPFMRLEGVIGDRGKRGGLNLASIQKGLDEAFTYDKQSEWVFASINSPGGSPVQSSLIYQYLMFLKKKHSKKLAIFVEDVAASGGYYIACAADIIIADGHSVVGSIGVVSGGFGFVKAIEKIGVERRLYTSGENKAMLDPFSEENPHDIQHLKALQQDIHAGFKAVVQESRGEKLINPTENEIFTGKFWTARQAIAFGLVDKITTIQEFAYDLYANDYKIVPLALDKRGFFEKRFGIFCNIFTNQLIEKITWEGKISLWNRFLNF